MWIFQTYYKPKIHNCSYFPPLNNWEMTHKNVITSKTSQWKPSQLWTKASETSCGSWWDFILFQTSRLCSHFYFQVSRFLTYFDECCLTNVCFCIFQWAQSYYSCDLFLFKNKPLVSMKLFHVDFLCAPFPIHLFPAAPEGSTGRWKLNTASSSFFLFLFLFFFLNHHFLFMFQT